MAKYRRYRKYSRRRKGLWSSRIQNISGAQSASANNLYIINYTLAANPAQSNDTVSIKYTVKNINCQLELESPSPGTVENLQAYVMFIPQGFVDSEAPSAYSDIPFQHPEWIMAYRFYGSASNDNTASATSPGFPPIRLSSRLARKLDTGDRIVLIILGQNTSAGSVTLDYRGLVRYNTKAN